MYSNYKSGEIHLWCEVEEKATLKKADVYEGGSRREDREARVDEAYEVLLEKHKDKFSTYQYTLWARMLVNKLHHSYDEPPPRNPLMNTGNIHTQRKDTLVEAISGAAKSFAKAMAPAPPALLTPPHVPDQILSLGKSADIRMKNLEQLKCLQQLFESKVLTKSEFMEQKYIIMEALRKL